MTVADLPADFAQALEAGAFEPPSAREIALRRLRELDFGLSTDGMQADEDLIQDVTDALRDGWFSGREVLEWMIDAIEDDRARMGARQLLDD